MHLCYEHGFRANISSVKGQMLLPLKVYHQWMSDCTMSFVYSSNTIKQDMTDHKHSDCGNIKKNTARLQANKRYGHSTRRLLLTLTQLQLQLKVTSTNHPTTTTNKTSIYSVKLKPRTSAQNICCYWKHDLGLWVDWTKWGSPVNIWIYLNEMDGVLTFYQWATSTDCKPMLR